MNRSQRDHHRVTLCSLSLVTPWSLMVLGVLNGGVGRTEFSDVTYVAPCGGSVLASRPSSRTLTSTYCYCLGALVVVIAS